MKETVDWNEVGVSTEQGRRFANMPKEQVNPRILL
jgi:hypothetical protein